jgi:hypothetical protein
MTYHEMKTFKTCKDRTIDLDLNFTYNSCDVLLSIEVFNQLLV